MQNRTPAYFLLSQVKMSAVKKSYEEKPTSGAGKVFTLGQLTGRDCYSDWSGKACTSINVVHIITPAGTPDQGCILFLKITE